MILAATTDAAARLLELGALVVVLAVAARVALRLKMSTIPLYLFAGVALGAISHLSLSEDFIAATQQIGIVLLLFALGLEYSALELTSGLRTGFAGALIDFGLNFPPGFVAAELLGWGSVAALILGGVTYVSSSGIVAKVIADLGRMSNAETRPILSLLVLEDLAMTLYLPFLGVALTHAAPHKALVSVAAALALVAIVFIVALRHGHKVTRIVWHESDEVVLLSTLALVLLIAGISERAHVSGAIGAFLLGIAFSGPVADRARAVVAPLRDLFAATFFLFFAIQIQLRDVGPMLGAALALALVSSLTKIATGWIAAGSVGADPLGRLRAGTALIARGEFSIVIAGLGARSAANPRLSALAAAYVLATATAGPLLTRAVDTLGHRSLPAPVRPKPPPGQPPR